MKMYQVDTFADQLFKGNPAAVVPLDSWLSDLTMQSIAMENNLSETAFFVPNAGQHEIRWFTPTVEVDLCGHATLAAAHVLFFHLGSTQEELTFVTRHRGELKVRKDKNMLLMDFPADQEYTERADTQPFIESAIGTKVIRCVRGTDDYLVEVASEEEVLSLKPRLAKVAKLEARGLLVTARATKEDFVSRCFFPRSGIDEDPVTGSAHTLLAPYWAHRLSKDTLVASQASPRSGIIHCQVRGKRVELGGKAVTYLVGEMTI